jgi:hypothetical protein
MSKISELLRGFPSKELIEETVPSVPKLAVNVILSIALVTTFIGIFFFTYAKDVERKIVVKNVNYLVDNIGDSVIPLLPGKLNQQAYDNLNNFQLPDMTGADKDAADQNKKLLTKAGKVIGTLFVVCIAVSYFICKKYNLDFSELLITNLFLLLAIAFTEYIFLNTIIFNYISVDPNHIKAVVIETLKNK